MLAKYIPLLREHGLADWKIELDNAKARVGACNYSKKKITISKWYLKKITEAELNDTVLHEIAHAIAGKNANHGPVWVAAAKAIGCTGERCYKGDAKVKEKFSLSCPCGATTLKRHRLRRSAIKRWICKTCNGHLTCRKNREM